MAAVTRFLGNSGVRHLQDGNDSSPSLTQGHAIQHGTTDLFCLLCATRLTGRQARQPDRPQGQPARVQTWTSPPSVSFLTMPTPPTTYKCLNDGETTWMQQQQQQHSCTDPFAVSPRLASTHLTRPSVCKRRSGLHSTAWESIKEESLKIQINIKIKKRLRENQPP